MTFRQAFPSEMDVAAYFVPARWGDFLKIPKRCTEFSEVTLHMLDKIYRKGLAESIVKNNLVGLFSVTRPRDPLCVQAIELTAQLFVGKYGTELSVYGMLHFFATYLTDYKGSYGQFDLTDVLRQCGKAYLPRWRANIAREEKEKATPAQTTGKRLTGLPALVAYLQREYVDKGIDVRASPLFNAKILKGTALEPIIKALSDN